MQEFVFDGVTVGTDGVVAKEQASDEVVDDREGRRINTGRTGGGDGCRLASCQLAPAAGPCQSKQPNEKL